MFIRVLLRGYPHRSIALVTKSHALIFHHTLSTTELTTASFQPSINAVESGPTIDNSGTPRCVVEFSAIASVDLKDYDILSPQLVFGTLGLITISNDVFLCVVKEATKVASVRPGETIEKISGVEFYCLNKCDYDEFVESIGPRSADINHPINLMGKEPLPEHPCLELKKLLGNGSFYYSTDFDLTNRLQDRSLEEKSLDMDNMDESFLWNSYMISPLVRFRSHLLTHEKEALDRSRILTSAIRGFVLTTTIPSTLAPLRTKGTETPSYLTIVSRLSCKRAGTRFNSRGIDDDGNVANFVESETIYWSPCMTGTVEPTSTEKSPGICFSYVQVRGSVPVFWEQTAGLIPGQQKVTITRSAEGSQPTFDKHINELEQNYGSVHIINLLSETKPGEAELTNSYRKAMRKTCQRRTGEKNAKNYLLNGTEFDFHAETKGPSGYEAASMIRRLIKNSADGFAYYSSEDLVDPIEDSQENPSSSTVLVFQQQGVFRTNCLDCLDRTNLIQTIISQMATEIFLAHRGEQAASEFWMRHSSIWADNGDALSRIYAGTGALKTSFTRYGKMSLAGAIADARKSATRLYINNFADKGRQNTIDLLLGRLVGQTAVHLFDPINEYVTAKLDKRSLEYETSETIKIWCGTFNLNGRSSGIDADLSSWLCPGLNPAQQTPDIVAVGFQEIVELSPQQIMNSDPTPKQAWEKAVYKALNKQGKADRDDRYVLLRSGQLVGAALMIFVKKPILGNLRNVEGSLKKTGLSGMAGNKGAVAIRMDYANTSICFVTAHFAAGFANYDERNHNYKTISNGLRFQRNRGIDDHETVIWMGDFNYRIGLDIVKVKQLIDHGDLGTLYENDQMSSGLAFPLYSESRITFMPTYKFHLNEDFYDTTEKARIPAWTDRILRKGANIRQVNYNIAQLRFSDHRPVYATFLCTVRIIDDARREALSRQIYEECRARIDPSLVSTQDKNTADEDLIGFDSIEPELPLVEPSQKEMILNFNRPPSLYTATDESGWVTVPRVTEGPISRSIATPLIHEPIPVSCVSDGMKSQLNAFDLSSPVSTQTQNRVHAAIYQIQPKSAQKANPLLRSRSTEGYRSSPISASGRSKNSPAVARKPVHLTSSPIIRKPVDLTSSSSAAIPNSVLSPVSAKPATNYLSASHDAGYQNVDFIKNESKNRNREAPTPPLPRRSSKSPKSSSTNISLLDSSKPPTLDIRLEKLELLGGDLNPSLRERDSLRLQ